MILGRTPEGAIKIKTDEEGGGLRAVNCACCVNCGCATAISGDLLQTMRNATTGTCNGASPLSFNASGGGFSASWYVSGTFYTCALSALTNCFSFGADNFENTMASGPAELCCPTDAPFPITCADVTYTINGDEFTAHTENFGFGSDVTPPTFVFS
jgi:hypothetical protein